MPHGARLGLLKGLEPHWRRAQLDAAKVRARAVTPQRMNLLDQPDVGRIASRLAGKRDGRVERRSDPRENPARRLFADHLGPLDDGDDVCDRNLFQA